MNRKQYEEQLIKSVLSSLEKHGAKNLLSSVILTGSFGRDEPTYMLDSNEDFVLKSDVEIALVCPSFTKKKVADQLVAAVAADFKEELNLMTITEKRVRNAHNFNFSMKEPEYKTIFTYDLFNGSYTIWGFDFIGTKSVMLKDCDLYEAKRIVANRIGELVYNEGTANKEVKDYLRMQWKGKLMLAIVSGWLICEKLYVSSYHGQHAAVHNSEESVIKVFDDKFIDEYEKVFAFLREDGRAYEVPDDILKYYVSKINDYYFNVGVGIPRVNSFSRKVKYFMKYLKCGMGYGIFCFEDKILQALIDDYCNGSETISRTADIWHKVIY